MQVTWKKGTQHKVDADVAYQQIEAIRKRNNGDATADDVVKAAASKRNPLHPEFEWNDGVAAHQFRLVEARRMLSHIVVVRDDIKTDRPQRVYNVVRSVSPASGQRAKHVYKTTDDIMRDEDLRAELLHRALRELISFRDRYRDLNELAIVLRSIDETLEKVEV